MISFVYNDDGDMMAAQVHLIDLGKHVLKFCDYVNDLLKENYYKMLTAILKRGELELGQMAIGFHENYKGSVAKKVLKSEIAIVVEY